MTCRIETPLYQHLTENDMNSNRIFTLTMNPAMDIYMTVDKLEADKKLRGGAARMEPGKRVAALVVDNATPWFSTPVYLHFVSWYQAKTGGVVDFNFSDFQSVLLRPNVGAPHVTEVLAWRPWFFEWTTHGGSRYDYFVVKSEADVTELIFKDHVASVELVAREGSWWVFRNAARTVDPSSSD